MRTLLPRGGALRPGSGADPRPNAATTLAHDIDRHGRAHRRLVTGRLRTLLDALDRPRTASRGSRDLVDAVTDALTPLDDRRAWVTLAVLTASLPSSEEVLEFVRTAQADGITAALRPLVRSDVLTRLFGSAAAPRVEIVRGAVLVDVDHTAKVSFATGIQRVTRETVRRWVGRRDLTLVGWHPDRPALRRLTTPEATRACTGGPEVVDPDPGPVLIPVDCTYILPELATEPSRTTALLALGRHSGTRTSVIGYDLCPITVPETTGPGMPAAFARNLAAMRYAGAVATISEAAAVEYRGWARMLPQIGIQGPRVTACLLPNEGTPPAADVVARAADRLLVGDLPMVFVVGSHEPRKNHLAVLHAAELLWREGLRFSLTFVGGNSWGSDRFVRALDRCQAQGHPVESISAATDELLWGGYALARCTVFPSFNEGFGLPVVESIACGTPVITSDFGSLAEITVDGGALLVDPRDDHAIAGALRTLLTDDAERERLADQARRRPERTWDTYADEVWGILGPPSDVDHRPSSATGPTDGPRKAAT